MSTDEVLERIQQQMAEVMANAQEVANSAVTTENEALAVAAVIDNKTGGKNLLLVACASKVSYFAKTYEPRGSTVKVEFKVAQATLKANSSQCEKGLR